MGSAIPRGKLAEIVQEARSRTGVPAVAAGLSVDGELELAADGPCEVETPFRIASITKLFTASLATLVLDEPPLALLSHTAGLRSDSRALLPEVCRDLWSYSNAGYCLAGEAVADAAGVSFSDAMQARILGPLGLETTTFEEPPGAAEGHVQDGEMGHLPAGSPPYAASRRPAGGLWSTVGDLLGFAAHQVGGAGPLTAAQLAALHEPHAAALGAEYCLGCWKRELADGRVAYDHEGSVGGFQSLLLFVPEEQLALAVLTNSWRGSGVARRVVRDLGLVPARTTASPGPTRSPEPGQYELDGVEASVDAVDGGWRVAEGATDPLTRTRIERAPFAIGPLGGGAWGSAGGLLMSHRFDFPREGVARIGWFALPRVGS
jgi:CubicO group peptidase (beta-lactamase class C family)